MQGGNLGKNPLLFHVFMNQLVFMSSDGPQKLYCENPFKSLNKVKSASSLVAYTAGAYPGFRSIKQLGVFLLPPGWDAGPSQGYPPALFLRYPFIHLGGEKHYESKVSCLRTQHSDPCQARARTRTVRSGVQRTNH